MDGALPIYIDDREGSKRLIHYPALRDVCELSRLESADACIIGNGPGDEPTLVGVEVKSVYDLISSMNTGRLQATQVPAMLAAYRFRWLLHYGAYRCSPDGELMIRGRKGLWHQHRIGGRAVPYGYLESFLFDLAAIGFNVKRCESEDEAAAWLACLHRWWSKPWAKHKGMRKFDESREMTLMPGLDAHTQQIAAVAKGLPGLGFERAVAAAKHFDSIEDLICASKQRWLEVDGIGPVIAGSVVEIVRRKR